MLYEVITLIQRAYALSPEDAAVTDSMGWVNFRLGNYQEAERYLRKALSLRDGDPEIAAHLGELLWVQNRRDEAQAIWNKARITSYNVCYTKLLRPAAGARARTPRSRRSGWRSCRWRPPPHRVITSYSIHYTKLYDPGGRSAALGELHPGAPEPRRRHQQLPARPRRAAGRNNFV